jgi:protein-arginine kinase activator protein McsA
MLCDKCRFRQATIHVTQIVDGKMLKSDLCEDCDKEQSADATVAMDVFGHGEMKSKLDRILANDSRFGVGAYKFVMEALSLSQVIVFPMGRFGYRHI